MDKLDHNILFNEFDLAPLLKNIINSIKTQVEDINEKLFLNTPADKIIRRLLADNSLNQLKLYEHFVQLRPPVKCKINAPDKKTKTTDGRFQKKYIDGIKVRIEIPFSGDERLWKLRPSIFHTDGGPDFSIKNGRLIKDYIQPVHRYPYQVKSEFKHDLCDIKKYLGWQNLDIQQHDDEARKTTEEAVSERRAKLQKLNIISKRPMVNIKPRDRSADFCPINIRQKISNPIVNYRDKPDQGITEADFIKIIRVIRHIGCSCERTPKVFMVHNENELRDIITATLNTQFEGSVENDLFIKGDKTSISISKGGKKAFVSICKIWSCKDRFENAINKLLEYEFWQDGKAALIIFNKNESKFSEILNLALHKIIEHPDFLSYDNKFAENEWHFTMQSPKDESCRISLHVMIFDLYTKETTPRVHLTKQEINFFRV